VNFNHLYQLGYQFSASFVMTDLPNQPTAFL